MTEPTAKHRQEAREIVESVFRPRGTSPIYATAGRLFDELEIKFAAALSSRDAEIREVLEGLASKHYVSLGEYCWCRAPGTATKPAGDYHDAACLAARGLWERVRE